MPKSELYYLLEKRIYEKKVTILNEKADDRWLWLDVKNGKVFYDDIEFAAFKNISFYIYGFSNTILAKEIKPTAQFKKFIFGDIEHLSIKHTVLSPLKIYIDASGEFGKADGVINLKDRNVSILIMPSKRFKPDRMIRKFFKKTKNGLLYESKI
jgi:hypothetical protein